MFKVKVKPKLIGTLLIFQFTICIVTTGMSLGITKDRTLSGWEWIGCIFIICALAAIGQHAVVSEMSSNIKVDADSFTESEIEERVKQRLMEIANEIKEKK